MVGAMLGEESLSYLVHGAIGWRGCFIILSALMLITFVAGDFFVKDDNANRQIKSGVQQSQLTQFFLFDKTKAGLVMWVIWCFKFCNDDRICKSFGNYFFKV